MKNVHFAYLLGDYFATILSGSIFVELIIISAPWTGDLMDLFF